MNNDEYSQLDPPPTEAEIQNVSRAIRVFNIVEIFGVEDGEGLIKAGLKSLTDRELHLLIEVCDYQLARDDD